MQQASECTSTRRIKRRFLFKLAFLSIPRLGLMSLVLLTFGIYMIFPCFSTFLQVHRETSVPYDLSVTADPRDMERLSEIEGVIKITPVCRIPAQLKTDAASQSIEILGVFSSFLPRSFLEGGPFQDDTHTPFLVMNEAAAKAFQTEQGSAASITLDTRLTLNNQEAFMAGIFRNGSEQPICYMSYETAIRGHEQGEQQEFLLKLDHKGNVTAIAKSLESRYINIELNENELLRWDLMRTQSIQFLITGCLSLMCAFGIIRKQAVFYSWKSNDEMMILSGLGFTKDDMNRIAASRIIMASCLCSAIGIVLHLLWK